VAVAVVEHRLEHPAGAVQLVPAGVGSAEARQRRVEQQRPAVAVLDPLQVAVGRADAVALIGPREVHAAAVLPLVFVEYGVALVVVALAD
jgi:hypothetical protein